MVAPLLLQGKQTPVQSAYLTTLGTEFVIPQHIYSYYLKIFSSMY